MGLKLGKKTNTKITFIRKYLSENGLANLTSTQEVYEYIKQERAELVVLRPTVIWYQKVFDTYYHYLQASEEQKELIIKTFVAYRDERLESMRRTRERKKKKESANKSLIIGEVTSEQSSYSRKNAQRLYDSPEWQQIRYFVLKRDKGICQLCGRSRKDGVVLHVDHIVPLSIDWSKRLNPQNLQTLCADCNLGKSNHDCIDWR